MVTKVIKINNEYFRKPKRSRIKGGKWGWLGSGGVVEEKWKQLCLNNNENKRGGKKDIPLEPLALATSSQCKNDN